MLTSPHDVEFGKEVEAIPAHIEVNGGKLAVKVPFVAAAEILPVQGAAFLAFGYYAHKFVKVS